jgi:hypothetical protein
MVVRNDLDRFHLTADAIDRLPQLGNTAAYAKQAMRHLRARRGYARNQRMALVAQRAGEQRRLRTMTAIGGAQGTPE